MSLYIDKRRPFATPSKAKRGQIVAHPSALESVKLAMYSEMLGRGVKKSDHARCLGWHVPQVDRLLNLNHISCMEHLENVSRSLGGEIRLSVV